MQQRCECCDSIMGERFVVTPVQSAFHCSVQLDQAAFIVCSERCAQQKSGNRSCITDKIAFYTPQCPVCQRLIFCESDVDVKHIETPSEIKELTLSIFNRVKETALTRKWKLHEGNVYAELNSGGVDEIDPSYESRYLSHNSEKLYMEIDYGDLYSEICWSVVTLSRVWKNRTTGQRNPTVHHATLEDLTKDILSEVKLNC